MKNFFDLRKPQDNHLYYVYVHGSSDGENKTPPILYKVGSVKTIKNELRCQKLKFDIFKVW